MTDEKQKEIQKPIEEKPKTDIVPPKFDNKKGGFYSNENDENLCEDENEDEQFKHLFDDE